MYVDLCYIYWCMLTGSSLWRDLKDVYVFKRTRAGERDIPGEFGPSALYQSVDTSGWREVNTVFIHGPHDICRGIGREWGGGREGKLRTVIAHECQTDKSENQKLLWWMSSQLAL